MTEEARVLVVDDEQTVAGLIRTVLERAGHPVRTAASGPDALRIIRGLHPEPESMESSLDVVVLDIVMAGMDGFEVLRHLKENPLTMHCRVIMLTALTDVQDKIKAFSAGASDYIVKPFENSELLARVETQLRLRQAERKLKRYSRNLEREVEERTRDLRENEERYHALFSESIDAIYIARSNGSLVDMNDAGLDLFGYRRDEMLTFNTNRTYRNPADRERFIEDLKRNGYVRNFAVQLEKSDGGVMDCVINAVARRDESGSIIGSQGIIRDVTQQRRSREALTVSEERYRTIVDNAFDAIFVLRGERYEFVNPRFCEITGYTMEELTAPDFDYRTLLTDRSRNIFMERYEARKRGEFISNQFQIELVNRLQRVLFLDVSTVPLGRGEDVAVMGIMRDVTDRIKAERLRHEEEEKRKNVIVNTAHVLHTPLTVVKGNLELVAKGKKEFNDELLQKLLKRLEEMKRLISSELFENIDLMSVETHDGITPYLKQHRDWMDRSLQ